MCGTIIKILFLVAGLILIFSGKVPEKFFKVLFGKGRYELSPTNTRLFGIFLASPFPAVFIISFFVTLIFGTEVLDYLVIFETVYLLAVVIGAVIFARRFRKPEAVQNEVIDIEI